MLHPRRPETFERVVPALIGAFVILTKIRNAGTPMAMIGTMVVPASTTGMVVRDVEINDATLAASPHEPASAALRPGHEGAGPPTRIARIARLDDDPIRNPGAT